MPEVSLILKVKEEGSIEAVVNRAVQSMDKVRQATASASREMAASANPYAKASDQIQRAGQSAEAAGTQSATAIRRLAQETERAAPSARQMHQAIGAMALAFGSVSPGITGAVLELSRFGGELGGTSVKTKLLAGGILAVGSAASAMMYAFQETQRVGERFAGIQSAVSSLDFGTLRSGLKAVAVEMDGIGRSTQSVMGRAMYGGRSAVNWALGLPSPMEESSEAQKRMRAGLQAILPWEAGVEEQQYVGKMASLRRADIQQRLQTRLSQGSATSGEVTESTRGMQDLTLASAEAARAEVESQRKKELVVANTERILDIEGPEIEKRYQRRLAIITQQEQTEYQAIWNMRLAAERTLAKQEMAEQEAILKESQTRRLAAMDIGSSVEPAIRHAGTATYLGGMSDTERARSGQFWQQGATMTDLAAVQAAGDARVAEITRTQTQIKAAMQGYLAQNLMSERDYTDKVRALDAELAAAKMQGLQQYSQALASALAAAAGEYATYAQQVRALEAGIRETKRTTSEGLAEIAQAGMSPEAATADRERRAELALWDAQKLEGADQVEALKRVQAEYRSLGVEAAKASQESTKAGKATTDTFEMAGDSWRSTPGQRSQAYTRAWASTPGGPGSAEWWAGGAWGQGTYDPTGSAAAAKSQAAAQTAADKVKQIGDLLVKSQESQKSAAQDSAAAALRMVDSLTLAANEAARLASALASAQAASLGAIAATTTQQSQVPLTWDMYGRPIYDTARAAESRANSDAFVKALTDLTPEASDLGLPTSSGNYEGGLGFNAAGGAVVPGPRGKAVLGIAHSGEAIFTPDQIKALVAGGGGMGGNLVVQMMVNGETVVGQIAVPLQKAIAAGRIRVN